MDLSQFSDEELMRAAGPISVRNNNPGNIRADAKSFRSYDTPQAGLDAMRGDLTAKVTGRSPAMAARFGADYQPTLANLITTYAPPTENDTASYINTVANATGINPNQPLQPQDIDKIMPAMIRQEGGDIASQYYTKVIPTSSETTGLDYSALSDDELMQATGVQPQAAAAPTGRDMGRTAATVQGFNSAVPFGNRIAAGLGAATAPVLKYLPESLGGAPNLSQDDLGSYSDRYNQARASQQTTGEANPNYETAGMVGGIANSLPFVFSKAIGATPVLGKTANVLKQASTATGNFIGRGSSLAARAGRSALVAAPTSAVYSYGASPNDLLSAEAAGDAAAGFGYGAAGGVALPLAGAAAGSALGYAADKIAARLATRGGEIADVARDPALQKVYKRLVADYGEDGAQKIINSYASTKGKSLVEAGGARTVNLAEGAAQYPSGGAAATEFFEGAVGSAPEKLKAALNKTVSPSVNYYDTAEKIVDEGRAKVAPLYDQAFKSNQQINSPVVNRILETPEGRSALGEAARNMQNEMALLSKPDAELTALAREAGMQATGQGVGSGLKLRTLDYVKRAMDDTIRTARRAGDEGQVRRITQLKNGLLSEMDAADKTKLYARARMESGDYLSATDALEQGTRFLKDDSQLIARNYKAMGATERTAYKAGVLKAMRENIENTADGGNVARIFNKAATRDKLNSILSAKEYSKLLEDAQATDNIYKLRNQITGNSRTAGRQIAAEEFNNETSALIGDLANRGATRVAIDKAIGIVARQFNGLSDQAAGNVAKILYETDPQAKYKIVKDLSNLAKQNNPRGTQAAEQLRAFYSLSDALKMRGSTSAPTRIEVNPNQKNPYKQVKP